MRGVQRPGWYNQSMANTYFIQLIGVILIIAGVVALTVSAQLIGIPMSGKDKRRHGRERERQGNVYRLPINLETLASAAFLLGGLGILGWTKFNLCAFLAHWLQRLPDAIGLFLNCK